MDYGVKQVGTDRPGPGPLVRALDRLDKEVEVLSQKAGGLMEQLQPLFAQVPQNAKEPKMKDVPVSQSVVTGRVENVANRVEQIARILGEIAGMVEL